MKKATVQQDNSIQEFKTFDSTDSVLLDDEGWVEFDKDSKRNHSIPNQKDSKIHTGSMNQQLPYSRGNNSVSNGAAVTTPPRKLKMTSDKTQRPPTPSMEQRMQHEIDRPQSKFINSTDDTFVENSCPIKIDVKPLPKIRLDLMPSPREADEIEEEDSF